MDVGYFLKNRVAFIRQFFVTASFPFVDRKRKIEEGEEPFIPPYSEDGEPPFLEEWIEAEESLQVLGYSCLSMLSASLHLYLKTWESKLGKPAFDSSKYDFKKGWLNGYKKYFAVKFGIDFAKSHSDLDMLEEMVLARNRIQHPDDLINTVISYCSDDLKKLPHKFFIDDTERRLFVGLNDVEVASLFSFRIHITEEKLVKAFEEVEKFGDWFEGEITRVQSRA